MKKQLQLFVSAVLMLWGFNASSQVFVESFNSGGLPSTWDNANECNSTSTNAFWKSTGTQTPGFGASGIVDNTGAPNSTAVWVDGSTPYPCTVNLTTDYIDVTSLAEPSIELHWFKNNIYTTGGVNTLVVSAVDMSGVYPLWSSNNDDAAWQKAIIDASCLALDSFQIRLTVEKGDVSFYSQYEDIIVDDIKVVELDSTYNECIAPISMASFPTPTSATINLGIPCNDGAATYVLIDTLMGPGVAFGAPMMVTNGSVELTSLLSGMDYEIYAYTDCGSGSTSDTLGPHMFSTPCAALATPYSDDFDQGQYYPGTSIYANDAVLGCFTTYGDQNNYQEWQVASSSTSSYTGPLGDANTGYGNYLYREASLGQYGVLRSPLIDLSGLTDPFFSFDYHYYGNSAANIIIKISNDYGQTWTEHKLMDESAAFGNQSDAWQNTGFSLAPYANDIVYVELIVEETASYSSNADFAIDNVSIDEAPACYNPIATIDNVVPGVNFGSVEFEFLSGKTISYSYKEVGKAVNLANGVVFTPQYTFNNLAVNKAYEFSFFNICSSSFSDTFDVQVFVSPLNPCAPQTAPYVETFEITSTKRQCWTEVGGAEIDATWYLDSSHVQYQSYPNPTLYYIDTNFIPGEGTSFARLGTGTGTSGTSYSGSIESGVYDFSALSSLQIDLLVAGGYYSYTYSSGSTYKTEPNFYIDYRTSSSGSWNRVLEYVDTIFDGWTQVSIDEPIIDLSSTMEFRFGYIGGGLPIAVDSISFSQGSTCVKPLNPLSYNTTTTSTDVLWTGISSGYEYTYGEVLTSVSYAPVTVSSATASLSNLSPQTSYWFVVKGDCGGGTYTTFSDTLFFDTECSSIASFPYVESFESTSVYEKCWSQEKISGTPQDWDLDVSATWNFQSSNTAYDGTEYARGSSDYGFDQHRLISPVIDAASLTTLEVTFFYGHMEFYGDQNSLELEYRLSDTDPWVTVWNSGGNDITVWTQGYAVIPVTSATMQIAFKETDDWGHKSVIDYITLDEGPTCLPVNLAGVTNVTSSSAYVTVDASPANYELYIELPTGVNGVPTFAQATGTSYSITNDSAMTISGLAADSTYGVFVRKICGTSVGDTSDWMGPVLFKTMCATQSLPYSEMFEGDDLGCWSQEDVSGSNKLWTLETGSNGSNSVSGPAEGDQYIHHTSSYGGPFAVKLISPVIDVDGINTLDISFKYDISEYWGDQNEIKVYVRSFPNGTWTEHLHLNTDTEGSWTDASVIVNVAADTNVQVAFEGIDDWGYPAALDSIYLEEGPFCPEPANVTLVPTNNSVTITWDSPNGTNSGSNIEWGSLNFVQGTGAAFGFGGDTSGVTSPFTLTGLSPDSTYSIYIQDSCSNGDVTDWVGPFSFTTTCDAVIAPYFESFEANSSNKNCWSEEVISGNPPAFAVRTGNGISANAPAPDGTSFVRMGSGYSPFGEHRYVSPIIDASALSSTELSLYWANEDWAGDLNHFRVEYRVSPTDPWISLLANDSAEVDYWKFEKLTIPSNSSTLQIAIYENVLYGWGVEFDGVRVGEPLTCSPISNLVATTVNSNDATLNWSPGSQLASSWVVKMSDPSGMVTYSTVADTTATLTGLSGGSEYCITIGELCTSGDTIFSTETLCFTTQCGIVYAPYAQDFASYQYDFNCWTRSSNLSAAGSGSQWEGTGGDWMTGSAEHIWGNTPGQTSTYPSTSYNYAIGVNGSSPFNAVVTVESPEIDVTTLVKPRLEFHTISGQDGDTVVTWLGDTISNGQNTLVVDMWDGASWNDSIYVNASDSVVWDTAFFELNQFNITGPVKVRFTVHKTAVIPAFDDILLDNFSITDDPAALTCTDIDTAYAFDITCADAMISWGTLDSNGVMTQGSSDTNRIGTVVYLGTDSVDMMANAKYYTSDTALYVDGLLPGVDYYFWAMDSCISGNTSKVIGSYMFTAATAPLPILPTIAAVNDTVGTTSDWTITLTGDTTATYTWDINGTSYNGMVITPSFTSNGTVTATLTVTNDCGSVDTTISITVTQIGLEELALDVSNIYPNPSNGAFNVEFTSSENLDYRIELMDAMGRLVSIKEGRTSNRTEVRFDTNLPAGVYIVKTIVGKQMNIDRVTIRR